MRIFIFNNHLKFKAYLKARVVALFLPYFYKPRNLQKNLGMSVLEVLVMAAIVATVAVVTIGSFPVGTPRSYIRTESEKLALDIRRVQNYAISGKARPNSTATPQKWSLRIRERGAQPDDITIYADNNGNCRVNAGEIAETFFVGNGVDIASLTSSQGSENQLNFCFAVPYGEVVIYDNNSDVGSFGSIRMSRIAPNQVLYRDIQMRVSGQISITGN